ncbi:hypothetical protein SCOR_22655 [Sulfidibacter corallicola]|uniref:Uncharacterized protein n=1 Tax=Sulfidibacter corallicola TaxID=2818388 RepID=A0A8A4U225_SULCO|nr:hypothetical protein [Sulfidibacter corallicola]QTD52785.1 hypothetical protein J3U87_09940 [Sulfidibacter corallicola]
MIHYFAYLLTAFGLGQLMSHSDCKAARFPGLYTFAGILLMPLMLFGLDTLLALPSSWGAAIIAALAFGGYALPLVHTRLEGTATLPRKLLRYPPFWAALVIGFLPASYMPHRMSHPDEFFHWLLIPRLYDAADTITSPSLYLPETADRLPGLPLLLLFACKLLEQPFSAESALPGLFAMGSATLAAVYDLCRRLLFPTHRHDIGLAWLVSCAASTCLLIGNPFPYQVLVASPLQQVLVLSLLLVLAMIREPAGILRWLPVLSLCLAMGFLLSKTFLPVGMLIWGFLGVVLWRFGKRARTRWLQCALPTLAVWPAWTVVRQGFPQSESVQALTASGLAFFGSHATDAAASFQGSHPLGALLQPATLITPLAAWICWRLRDELRDHTIRILTLLAALVPVWLIAVLWFPLQTPPGQPITTATLLGDLMVVWRSAGLVCVFLAWILFRNRSRRLGGDSQKLTSPKVRLRPILLSSAASMLLLGQLGLTAVRQIDRPMDPLVYQAGPDFLHHMRQWGPNRPKVLLIDQNPASSGWLRARYIRIQPTLVPAFDLSPYSRFTMSDVATPAYFREQEALLSLFLEQDVLWVISTDRHIDRVLGQLASFPNPPRVYYDPYLYHAKRNPPTTPTSSIKQERRARSNQNPPF